MTGLTRDDFPFIEQMADGEMETRLPGFWAILKDRRTDADRHLLALHILATVTRDEDTLRWVVTECEEIGSDANDVLCAVRRSECIPLDLLVHLAQSKYLMVVDSACSDERLPETEIRRIAAWSDRWSQKAAVAANPSTPADVLALMAADPDEHVRYRVAYNPHTPLGAAEALKADPDPWVRELVSLRGKGHREVCKALGVHIREEIRRSVADSIAGATPEELDEAREWFR